MKINIYQVNEKRDINKVMFVNSKNLEKVQGNSAIDSKIYDKIFSGDVDCKSLEDVFFMFNNNRPEGYRGRSLSVSDVVEVVEDNKVEKGFYFCDTFGFKKVDFEPSLTENIVSKNMITVLYVQANHYPKVISINNTLEAMQKLVGGLIEIYMPFEDEVAIVCNEEGKMNGLPLNRAVYAEDTMPHGSIDNLPDSSQHFEVIDKPLSQSEYNILLEEAKRLIDDFVREEYGNEKANYSDLSQINVAYTNTEDELHEIEAEVNLVDYQIVTKVDGKIVNTEQYKSLGDIVENGLNGLDFSDLVYVSDEQLAPFYKESEPTNEQSKKESKEMIDIIAGDFFIAYAPADSENFKDLPKELEEKYRERFKYPEYFYRQNGEIKAHKFEPKE